MLRHFFDQFSGLASHVFAVVSLQGLSLLLFLLPVSAGVQTCLAQATTNGGYAGHGEDRWDGSAKRPKQTWL